MAKALEQAIVNQITAQRIEANFVFLINGVNFSAYLMDYQISYDKKFGSASGTFQLNNNGSVFAEGGAYQINVGDTVELIEQYTGSMTEWTSFYGKVEQRTIQKTDTSRSIQLTCLDYISVLKHWDVDLVCEGTKEEITNEVLKPNYLSAPNDMFAHLFDFANESLADNPRPILTFKDKNHLTEDPQYDGFDIYYDSGQVKLGSPLNARDNYDLMAKSYYFYTEGIYCEDVLEQLLTAPDGYGNYLFGEATAQAVIDNHFTTWYDRETAMVQDYMTPNLTTSTITIKIPLMSAVSAGDTEIYIESVDSLPSYGTGKISGDIFTWNGVEDAESGHQPKLVGIPHTGSYAVREHPSSAFFEYEAEYPAGQVWYLTFSNLLTDLTASDFQISGADFKYLDKRFGRILLSSPINITTDIRCLTNYQFKTLQASGVELNRIAFKPREVENRFAAIEKLREYLAPNYIIRTQGDSKIWASYLSQKVIADYTLNLVQNITYHEDDDLYTRVIFYGKNKNPTNIMFNENIDFSTTGASYKAYTSQTELHYTETVDGWHHYETIISDAGYIVLDEYKPEVFINAVPVNDTLHQMIMQPIKITLTTRTVTSTTTDSKGNTSTSTRTYYYYKLYSSHQNIEPSQPITVYNFNGAVKYTIPAHDGNMDYANGVYSVPGDSQNSMIETLSTATYWVFYSTQNVIIDYNNVIFKIHHTLVPDVTKATVSASFEYFTIFTPAKGAANLIDGRWDTQVQTEFFAEPPNGYNYAILDFGSIQPVQAVDLVAGFYKPDEYRKFDIDFRMSLQYSTDGVKYYEIGDKTHNVQLTGGASVSFEEEDLGAGFETRYIKIILEHVRKIDYEEGIYVAAMTEISAYSDVILKAEARLTPTTTLTQDVNAGDTTVYVTSTAGFTEPGSAETATAYIGGDTSKSFTYTYIGSANTFEGCTVESGITGSNTDMVSQSIESDYYLYDEDLLLPKLGDRVFKQVRVKDDVLYTQAQLDDLAKHYLEEFYKNHSKLQVNVLFSPFLKVGQTISLTDSYNNISDVNYFIEAIENRTGYFTLTLARYP